MTTLELADAAPLSEALNRATDSDGLTPVTGIGHDVPVTDAAEDTLPSLEFVGPVAGFPSLRRFVLVELEETGMLCSLRSLDDPDVRFLVLPPAPFFPDYAPEIADDWADQLELTSAEDALLLLVVTPGASAADATVNLLAPLVVNVRTRRAAQVLLDDDSLSLRASLRSAA